MKTHTRHNDWGFFDVDIKQKSEQRYFNFNASWWIVLSRATQQCRLLGETRDEIYLAFCVELQCHPISISDPISTSSLLFTFPRLWRGEMEKQCKLLEKSFKSLTLFRVVKSVMNTRKKKMFECRFHQKFWFENIDFWFVREEIETFKCLLYKI